MNKIIGYFKGVGLEGRRVRWPNRKTLWSAVGVVTTITVVAALVLFFEDWLTIRVMSGFEEAFSNSTEEATSAVEAATRLIKTFMLGGIL